MPVGLTAVCLAGLVGVALAGPEPVRPGVTVAQSGHWVINRSDRLAVHVHGYTERVDARVELPDDAVTEGWMVLQGATDGFVVGRNRVWVFDKSELAVDAQFSLLSIDDRTVGIEVPGGPYLVHPDGGIVRLTRSGPVEIPTDGPLGTPVGTADGTVWVQRTDDGVLCALRRDAVELDCSPGDEASAVRRAEIAPGSNLLRLIDGSGRPDGSAPDASLVPGEYGPPQLSGEIAAVVSSAGTLCTFTRGIPADEATLGLATAATAMRRGEDGRIYVDDGDGHHVHVVHSDGKISTVDLRGAEGTEAAVAAPEDQREPVVPPPPGQAAAPHPEADVRAADPPAPEQQTPTAPPPSVLAAPETPPQPAPEQRAEEPAHEQPTAPNAESVPAGQGPADAPIAPTAPAASQPSVPTPSAPAPPGSTEQAPGGTESAPLTTTAEPTSHADEVPVSTPEAPEGLTIVRQSVWGLGDVFQDHLARWQRPELHGGEFFGYEYRTYITDFGPESADPWQLTQDTQVSVTAQVCAPLTIEVRAVTKDDSGDTMTSTVASRPATPRDCSIHMTITAQMTGPDSISVRVSEPNPDTPAIAFCWFVVNGEDLGAVLFCGRGHPDTNPVRITNLPPPSPTGTYTVVLEIDNDFGPKTKSDPVVCQVGVTDCVPAPAP